MKFFPLKKVFLVIILLIFLSLYAPIYAAAPPSILSYQGRLTDASGNLLGGSSGTTYYFKFSIWDAVSGGNKLWPISSDPTSYGVTVREGVFNVNIGDTANGYPDTLDYAFGSTNVFLKVEVSTSSGSGFETLSPRQQITSSVFAQIAGAVSGSTTPSSFGTTTPFGTSVVSIEATSTQSTGLSIRGFNNQLANLFQIQDYLGSSLFVVDNIGYVGVGTSTATRKFNILDVNSVPQLRLSQASDIYGEFQVDNLGDLWLSSTGKNITQSDGNFWVCSGGNCDPAVTPVGQGNIIVETAVIFDNKFKLEQIDASTTRMYDTTGATILEFDEGE